MAAEMSVPVGLCKGRAFLVQSGVRVGGAIMFRARYRTMRVRRRALKRQQRERHRLHRQDAEEEDEQHVLQSV